jgi:hypothetical protein
MVNLMFIRFVTGEIDEDSHVSAGLFCAAFNLLDETVLPDEDYAALADLMAWFRVHLKGPFEYRLNRRGVHSEQSAGSNQPRTDICLGRGRWRRFLKGTMSSFG